MMNIIKQLNPFSNKNVDNKIIYVLKVLLTTFLVYFVSLLIGEAVIIGGSMLFGYNGTDHQLPQDIMLLCSFYGYIITILLFILFTKKVNKLKLNKIGFDKNFKDIFKGILAGVIVLGIIVGILLVSGAIKFDGINKSLDYGFLILFFFGYLVQSSMEEVVCRGYLLHRLKDKIPVIYAVLISFLAFSAGHFSKLFGEGVLYGIIGVMNLFLISMIWSIFTLKDKNIYASIGLHFIWNFMLSNVIGLTLSGIDTSNSIFKFTVNNTFLTGSSYGIEASIITTIILAIVLFVIKGKKKIK